MLDLLTVVQSATFIEKNSLSRPQKCIWSKSEMKWPKNIVIIKTLCKYYYKIEQPSEENSYVFRWIYLSNFYWHFVPLFQIEFGDWSDNWSFRNEWTLPALTSGTKQTGYRNKLFSWYRAKNFCKYILILSKPIW